MPERDLIHSMKQSDVSVVSTKTSAVRLPVDKRKTMIKVMDPSVHQLSRHRNDEDELRNSLVIGKGVEPKIETKRPVRSYKPDHQYRQIQVVDRSPEIDELKKKVLD